MLHNGTYNRKSALTSLLPLLTILVVLMLLVGCSSGTAPNATATAQPPTHETTVTEPPTAQTSEAAATELSPTQALADAATELPPTQASDTLITEQAPTLGVDNATKQPAATTPEASQELNGVVSTTDQVGFTPITHNADWTLVERDVNGVTMVLVPIGCFQMGRDGVNSGEAPEHEQCFSAPFWIDKTEVTNTQFAQFESVAEVPSVNTRGGAPRDSISELEAAAFCELRGARLPTEREWEYAASGPDNLIYPWGSEWVEDNAVWEGNSRERSAAAGSIPQNISWVGALDLSGNVWEWTSTIDTAYPYDPADGRESASDVGSQRVIRGGSWANQPQSLTTSFRLRNIPTVRDAKIGFRCVQDY